MTNYTTDEWDKRVKAIADDIAAIRAEARRDADVRINAARFVAGAWIADILASDTLRATGMSHPVAMVLAALDGETDPVQCGLAPEHHAGFLAALAAEPKP